MSNWRNGVLLAWPILVILAAAIGFVSSGQAYGDQPEASPAAPSEAAPAKDGGSAEAKDAPPIDAAQLELWVRELDDDRYAVREGAQKQLAAVGAQALDIVAAVAAKGSLESSTRAVAILVSWADSTDKKLSLAALEHVAALEGRPTEAAMAFERLAVVREAAAIDTIKNLGGRFDFDRSFGMVGGPNAPMQIIIGPEWKGGVEGLKHVAAVRSATTLSLHSAPLKDDAAAELAGFTQLRRVEIYGTEITPEAIQKLQPQLPNTLFDMRGGARLGIRASPIEQIVPDSPADKAGLERNDAITEFAGQPVESFDQLTKLIAACKPGDTVTVKVLRAGQTLEKSVTFDRWGDDKRTMMNSPELQQGFGPAQIQIQGGGRVIIQPGGQILPAPVPVPVPVERR